MKNNNIQCPNCSKKNVTKRGFRVHKVWDSKFYGIDIIDNGEEFGFEGCYNDDLNHPDPRPAHQIWIKKIHAEKLVRLFFQKFSENLRKRNYDFAYTFEEFMKESKENE